MLSRSCSAEQIQKMSLGNWEGWRSDDAEPEELPEYLYTMSAKDGQRIKTLFCHGQKSVLLYFAAKLVWKIKSMLFIFTVNFNEVKLMKKSLQNKIIMSVVLAGVFAGSTCVFPGAVHGEKRIADGVYEADVFDSQQNINTKDNTSLANSRLIIEGGEIKSTYNTEYREYLNGNAYAAYVQNTGTGNLELSGNVIEISGGKIDGEAVGAWANGKGNLLLTGNEVRLTGGTVGSAYAAEAFNPGEKEISLKENNLTVTGSETVLGTGAAAVINYLNGGRAELTDNRMTVSNSETADAVYGAKVVAFDRKAAEVTARRNSVALTDSKTAASANIYGADIKQDKKRFTRVTATDNSVSLNGKMLGNANIIYGVKAAEALSGNASYNAVYINVTDKYTVDGVIGARIDGGNKDGASELQANNNTVYVRGGDDRAHELLVKGSTGGGNQGAITGGRVYTATDADVAKANNNNVIIDSFVGNEKGAVNYGGRVDGYGTAKLAEANGNKISIGKNNRLAVVYGGSSSGTAAAADNNVIDITSSSVAGIYGGSASGTEKVTASGNSITVSNDVEDIRGSSVTAGKAKATGKGSATADNNIVRLKDTEFTLLTAAGIADSAEGDAFSRNNKLVIDGSKADFDVEVYSGKATSTSGTAAAVQNSVVINDGTFNLRNFSFIPGGLSAGAAKNGSGKSIASDNTIEINNGELTIGGEWKGTAYPSFINGGRANSDSGEAEANNNSVAVNGGTVKLTNRYDESFSAEFTSDLSGAHVESGGKAIAKNNMVKISGGKIIGDVYGAYAKGASAEITNNTVSIEGTADLSKAVLHGYHAEVNDKSLLAENNTLKIDGWKGNVQRLSSFDNIYFDNVVVDKDGSVVKITDGRENDLQGTVVRFNGLAEGQDLSKISKIKLLDSDKQLGIDKASVQKYVPAGAFLVLQGEGDTSEGGLNFKVKEITANKQVNAVTAGRAGSLAFVNQGSDLAAAGLDQLSSGDESGVQTFAFVQGGRNTYDVNDGLKINGWNSMVGVGNEKNISSGDFSWGVFYENGSGSYRINNEFNNEFFSSDGSVTYNGGGIAARLKRDNGIYIEGSLRAGVLKNEMTNALKDNAGSSYGYNSENSYYGAHIGAGKVISLNGATDLDVYGKFFHTYTGGDSFEAAKNSFTYDSITSDRLRLGARLTTGKENKLSTYYGLAYEYEFSGEADMKVQNISAPKQSLKGSSYIAEIGMNYKPGSESPWSFDLNMRGYAGQREGVSGSVQAVYAF